MTRMAWGAGLATIAADGSVLDTWYRWLGWGEYGDDETVARYPDLDAQLGLREQRDEVRNVTIRPIRPCSGRGRASRSSPAGRRSRREAAR